MARPETQFWQYWKKNTPDITWTRIENMSSFGTPDLLGYNKNQFFFTVELKVVRGNFVRLSPHQIAFHIRHPKNSFICIKHLVSSRLKLYEGSQVKELAACGLKLDACSFGDPSKNLRCLGLAACRLKLYSLGA